MRKNCLKVVQKTDLLVRRDAGVAVLLAGEGRASLALVLLMAG